ncbi:MAG: SDR family NAD(P)-dependent oxidoreductase [Desulfofustis sp.]
MAEKYLIYGGTGGIGSEIARSLADGQNEVFIVGRDPEKAGNLTALPGIIYISADVTEDGCCENIMESVGPELDGLVYAVGSINLGSLRRLGADDFINDFKINALGAALAVKAALTALKKGENSSSVVLISSVAAVRGFSLHASVGMAKGAVSGLTLSLAAELAPRIRVNAIAPSLTETPLSEGLLTNPQAAESIAAQHAMKRLGRPKDIARMACFLLSAEADWLTGQVISVDGGRSTL